MDDLDDLVGSVDQLPARKTQRRPKPRHVPDEDSRRDVCAWVAGGIQLESMARLLRIDIKTLRSHYREELAKGRDMANAMVAGGLFHNAVHEKNVTAQIFWTKTQMGWREKAPYDAENPLVMQTNGGPVDPKALARDLRDALMELARPRIAA